MGDSNGKHILFAHANIIRVLNDFDPVTALHCEKVSLICQRIGRHLDLTENDQRDLAFSGLVHDIGKIAIPKPIIQKPEALTFTEMLEINKHSVIGAIIADAAEYGATVSNAILHHHERIDGSGYPDGLTGGAVGLFSRIIAIADVYTAMTSDRPYRRSLSKTAAMQVLYDTQKYDSYIVKLLERDLGSPINL